MTDTMVDIHPALTEAFADMETPDSRSSWEAQELRAANAYGREITADDLDWRWTAALSGFKDHRMTRFGAWLTTVPARFKGAHLGGLTTEQRPDDLRLWLDDESRLTLLLVGAAGRGKTHAAYAIANHASARTTSGRQTKAWTVPGLLDALRPSASSNETTWEAAKGCPLLVLDDLANARPTDWSFERMWMLADARTADNLRTVITTNASWAQLEAAWGVPTMDRFRDRSTVVKFSGESHRRPA